MSRRKRKDHAPSLKVVQLLRSTTHYYRGNWWVAKALFLGMSGKNKPIFFRYGFCFYFVITSYI